MTIQNVSNIFFLISKRCFLIFFLSSFVLNKTEQLLVDKAVEVKILEVRGL